MSKSVQRAWRSRLTVAVGFGLTVAAAACSGGVSPATSPSGVTPSSLEANGQSTREFGVTVTPTSVAVGAATLRVTVTRNETSGQSQKLGSVEIYVPGGLTVQSVDNVSNTNWMGGFSGQTVRVGAVGGNHKLDGAAGRITVTFDIKVTSTQCNTYRFDQPKAANSAYADSFDPNWTYTGGELSVEVINCLPPAPVECKAAPAVANEYLDSIGFHGRGRGEIISSVAQHMTEEATFDGIAKCNVEEYRAAVVAYVIARLPV